MKAVRSTVDGGRAVRVALRSDDDRSLSWIEVVDRWLDDEAFRTEWNAALAALPFDACFWETPALTRATQGRAFEFVATATSVFEGVLPDERSFASHLERAGDAPVARFDNLGGDATLVVPTPRGPAVDYVHLLAFVRRAPEDQRDAFWRESGAAIRARLGDAPVWVSTSGSGVFWLHLRLDDAPKYYVHAPYRRADGR